MVIIEILAKMIYDGDLLQAHQWLRVDALCWWSLGLPNQWRHQEDEDDSGEIRILLKKHFRYFETSGFSYFYLIMSSLTSLFN